jgi:hypothetical protein
MRSNFEAQSYVEIMAPAFVDGMANADTAHCETNLVIEKLAVCQQAVNKLLEKQLANSELDIDRNHAFNLTIAAFDDAYALIHACRKVALDKAPDLPADFNVARAIQSGKTSLLRVGLIEDKQRGAILALVSDSRVADHVDGFDDLDFNPAITIQNNAGNYSFAWNESITGKIDQLREMDPNRGCPAGRFIIEDEQGTKRNLMNYFFDMLVENICPAGVTQLDY